MGLFNSNKDKRIIVPGYDEPEDMDNGVEIEGETITLPMEDGSEQEFHILDNIDYKGKQYMVLIADQDITAGEENTNFAVTIVRVNEVKVSRDSEPEFSIEPVTSKKIIEAVFKIFQEHMEIDQG